MILRLLLTATAVTTALLLWTSPPAAAQDTVAAVVVTGCSVSCNSWFFACCDCKADSCTCKFNGEPATNCKSGGPGAVSCSCAGKSAAVGAALDVFLGTLEESPITFNDAQQAAWQSLLAVLDYVQP